MQNVAAAYDGFGFVDPERIDWETEGAKWDLLAHAEELGDYYGLVAELRAEEAQPRPANVVDLFPATEPEPPTPAAPAVSFDRAAHCRRIGQTGGIVTFARYGSAHMRAIGTAGARVTIERHGLAYWQGLVQAKGWTSPRRPDLGADLAAGQILAHAA